ncbi:MAG: sensor histidine kinase [Candidatus Dormibacteria bacterium]
MSAGLGGFIAAHAPRTRELFATELRLGRPSGTGLNGHAPPDALLDSVLVALEDDNIDPLVTVCGLGNRPRAAAERLDTSLRSLDALGRAVGCVAAEEQLPEPERLALNREISDGFGGVSRRLATWVAGDLAEQLGAQTAAARGPSLSITMHELRRPLTILSSYGQLLAAGVLGEMPEGAQVAIEGITASTEMMVRMVNALAEVSRLEDPDDTLALEEMAADELVSAAIEHVGMEAQLRRVSLRRQVTGDKLLEGDRRRLALALTNIISNAVKHSPDDGEVTILVRVQAERVHFVVRDHGPGFPPEDAPHLFDKYFRSVAERQRKVPGSGLGLFIVRTIAERHRGEVVARIATGGGAEFELTIPLRQRG